MKNLQSLEYFLIYLHTFLDCFLIGLVGLMIKVCDLSTNIGEACRFYNKADAFGDYEEFATYVHLRFKIRNPISKRLNIGSLW